jgi:hypothetical protein
MEERTMVLKGRAALVAVAVAVAACSDTNSPSTAPVAVETSNDALQLSMFRSGGDAHPSAYVAMGTSISMGWLDDGVFAGSQAVSWTKQLADGAHIPFTVPSIDAPGCKPPFAAPLLAFKRVDGSSGGESAVCSPNSEGVILPTHNLAVENATASEGLNATPATASAGRNNVTSRVLPAGMTQVTAMRSLRPLFVSVEFGGNELLPAQIGVVAEGVTIVPFATFKESYDKIIENVKATRARAVLVSIRTDLRNFPTIRTGPEIAAQREAFRAYNVSVSSDCDDSPNYVFVRGKVLTAVATGAAMAGIPGAGSYTLSCADSPGKDYILTPLDIATLNALGDQMSEEIERHAAENRYAVFALGELFNRSKDGVPFDLNAYLRSATPYGPVISLDGVHPNAAGHKILADAARRAIIARYLHRSDD